MSDYKDLIECMNNKGSVTSAAHAPAVQRVFLERMEVVTDMLSKGISQSEIDEKFTQGSGSIISAERVGSKDAGYVWKINAFNGRMNESRKTEIIRVSPIDDQAAKKANESRLTQQEASSQSVSSVEDATNVIKRVVGVFLEETANHPMSGNMLTISLNENAKQRDCFSIQEKLHRELRPMGWNLFMTESKMWHAKPTRKVLHGSTNEQVIASGIVNPTIIGVCGNLAASLPSYKELARVFGQEEAKRMYPDLEEASKKGSDDACLEALNNVVSILEGRSINHIPSLGGGLSYISVKDCYDSTLVFDHNTCSFVVGSIGGIVERHASRFSENLDAEGDFLRETMDDVRSLSAIARDIRRDWKKVYFGAVPYLDAMGSLESIDDNFGADSAREIVLRFLSNASTWRGEVAKKIKAELKAALKKKIVNESTAKTRAAHQYGTAEYPEADYAAHSTDALIAAQNTDKNLGKGVKKDEKPSDPEDMGVTVDGKPADKTEKMESTQEESSETIPAEDAEKVQEESAKEDSVDIYGVVFTEDEAFMVKSCMETGMTLHEVSESALIDNELREKLREALSVLEEKKACKCPNCDAKMCKKDGEYICNTCSVKTENVIKEEALDPKKKTEEFGEEIGENGPFGRWVKVHPSVYMDQHEKRYGWAVLFQKKEEQPSDVIKDMSRNVNMPNVPISLKIGSIAKNIYLINSSSAAIDDFDTEGNMFERESKKGTHFALRYEYDPKDIVQERRVKGSSNKFFGEVIVKSAKLVHVAKVNPGMINVDGFE